MFCIFSGRLSLGLNFKNIIMVNYFIGANELKNMDLKNVEYLVEDLIPKGTLCALVGESDTGKSSLLRQLAVSITYGDEEFLGFKLNDSCRNVVYVSTEDGQHATSMWLNKYFGEDITDDAALSKLKFVFSTDRILENLRGFIKEYCLDLIIIDSYADIFTGGMNNSNEVRTFLNEYNNIVNEFGTTIMFLHHTKKSSAGFRPNKNSILGSQGFEAKMRSVLMLNKDLQDSSKRHLCVVKNNYMDERNKSKSYVLKFNEHLAFENTGMRVDLDELISDDVLEKAKKLINEGKTIRETAEVLNSDGHKVSKSSLHRKLK